MPIGAKGSMLPYKYIGRFPKNVRFGPGLIPIGRAAESSVAVHRIQIKAPGASYTNELPIPTLSVVMYKQWVFPYEDRVAELKGNPFILIDELPGR